MNDQRKARTANLVATLLSMAAVFGASQVYAADDQGGDQLTVAGLLKFEQARIDAEATRNVAALAQEVGDDLVLVHGGGDEINKAQYIALMKGAKSSILGIDLTHVSGAVIANVGVTDGIMTNHLQGGRKHISRYLGVYRYDQGHWSLIRWQTTDISRPAPPKHF